MRYLFDYMILTMLAAATITITVLNEDKDLSSYCVIMFTGLIILAFSNMLKEWDNKADKERIEFLRELLYKGKGEGDE